MRRLADCIGITLFFLVVAFVIAWPLSLICGCCPYADWPVELHVDEEFTAEEVTAIQDAVDEWDIATGTKTARLVLGHPHGLYIGEWADQDRHIVHRLREDESAGVLFRAESPHYVGKTSHGASIAIAIDFIRDMPYLTHIMSHELGHLYGICGHRPNTLMHGRSDLDLWCIDSLVLDEVCELQDACVEPRTTCQ